MKIKIKPAEIKTMVPMSATVTRLTNLMYDINAKTSDIARLIELDSVLTVNVLRWANSAFYRARVPVDSIRSAVVRLGMNNIIRLSIGDCLSTAMKKSVPGYRLAENELWRHNVAAAFTVETMTTLLGKTVHAGAFTAALLHDIGKVVVGQHLDADTFAQLHRLLSEEKLSYIEAERQLLETDHAIVGAAMAGYWKFPEELVHAIEKHHDPEPAPDLLLDTVMIANRIAKKAGAGQEPGEQEETQFKVILERNGLQAEEVGKMCAAVKDKVDQAEVEWNSY